MANVRSRRWAVPAIRVAAAGLGHAVAGPLGAALGGWLVGTLGGTAAALVEDYADTFGENAAEKLLETAANSLADRLKALSPKLQDAYRTALRLSLSDIHSELQDNSFDGWFANWDYCLGASVPLDLPEIEPSLLAPENVSSLFRQTMERLDRQGAALRRNDLSLTGGFRPMPDDLRSVLNGRLPGRLRQNFFDLIVEPEYETAWKQAQLVFEEFDRGTLERIDRNVIHLPQVSARSSKSRSPLLCESNDSPQKICGTRMLKSLD
jgi:hypothetical protein